MTALSAASAASAGTGSWDRRLWGILFVLSGNMILDGVARARRGSGERVRPHLAAEARHEQFG